MKTQSYSPTSGEIGPKVYHDTAESYKLFWCILIQGTCAVYGCVYLVSKIGYKCYRIGNYIWFGSSGVRSQAVYFESKLETRHQNCPTL